MKTLGPKQATALSRVQTIFHQYGILAVLSLVIGDRGDFIMSARVYVVPLLLLFSTLQAAEKPKPPLAMAPFHEAVAKERQKAWAEYLGVPVEVSNSIGMKLALIPAGEFLMGSPVAEDDRDYNETQHGVRITEAFYLGVYEVTQSEYERVMGRNPSYFSSRGGGEDNVSGQDTSRFPVEKVNWEDAEEFCRRLSGTLNERRAGRVYRLPTEAEWEYASRAGTTNAFHFGSRLNGREANCDGDSPYGTSTKGPNLERTTRVGAYGANAFGLYDMHGNVWEWCSDWYDKHYDGESAEDYRVYRGGSWYGNAAYCRAAFRGRNLPTYRSINLGFRVVVVSTGQSSDQ